MIPFFAKIFCYIEYTPPNDLKCDVSHLHLTLEKVLMSYLQKEVMSKFLPDDVLHEMEGRGNANTKSRWCELIAYLLIFGGLFKRARQLCVHLSITYYHA
jgi:hypothetical protein